MDMILLVTTLVAADPCPDGYVCVPRSVIDRMAPQDVARARQLAAQHGIRWKILENRGQARRGLKR
jgi:hypothetical protein